MRNIYNSKQKGFSEFRSETERIYAEQALSLDQIAIVWINQKEILAVSPVQNQADKSYKLDFAKLPADFNLTGTLDLRRKNQPNLPPVSEKNIFPDGY